MGKENVEAIVPLLPMQQGFLWHSLSTDNKAGMLVLRCTLRGNIQLPELAQAWQQVVNTHQALRSSVHWQDLSHPVQIVHKNATAPVEIIRHATDIADGANTRTNSGVSPNEDPSGSSVNRELELAQAPVHHLRLQVLDAEPLSTCHVEWSLSHILLDGWSCALVINDWLAHYSALLQGTPAPVKPSLPLKRYGQWLAKQDSAALIDFWNQLIPQHVPLVTPLPYLAKPVETANSNKFDILRHCLDASATEQLYRTCQHAGVSLNSVLQAAFALVLKPLDDDEGVVLSTTMSGRQVELAGIDTYVGMLINVIPVYVSMDSQANFTDWLREHQATFFSCLPHAHVNLPELFAERGSTSLSHDAHVNCLLVLENQSAAISCHELIVSDYRSGIISNMDVTLTVLPLDELEFELRFRRDRLDAGAINTMLQNLVQLLSSLPDLVDQPVSATNTFRSAQSNSLTSTTDITTSSDATVFYQPSNSQGCEELLKPSPLIEQQLSKLWAELFGYPVASDQAFFDLGGNSLQAVRLFDMIEQQLGVRLPATTLFASPTIRQLSNDIRRSKSSDFDPSVVQVNAGGTKTPLFMPFEQSDMLMYRHLIEELGPDQPVFGLQTHQTPLKSLSEIDALTDTIIRLHPQGPYLLAGLSGSGISAWLIAQKLKERGCDVSMLCLFDSYGPDYPQLHKPLPLLIRVARQFVVESARYALDTKTRRIGFYNENMSAHTKTTTVVKEPLQDTSKFAKRLAEDEATAKRFASAVTASMPLSDRIAKRWALWIARAHVRSFSLRMEFLMLTQGMMLQYGQRTGINPLSRSAPNDSDAGQDLPGKNQLEHSSEFNVLQKFFDRYQQMYGELQPYTGKMVYIAASQRPAVCLDDAHYGWARLMPETACVYQTPGHHLNMLKPPHVQHMAKVLKREMA